MSYPEALMWFIILYLAITGGGLFGIYQLSRIWRIVIYVLLGAGHIFCAFLWHGLSFIDRNNEFTEQTISLFNELAEQLHNGMIHGRCPSISKSASSRTGGARWGRFRRWFSVRRTALGPIEIIHSSSTMATNWPLISAMAVSLTRCP